MISQRFAWKIARLKLLHGNTLKCLASAVNSKQACASTKHFHQSSVNYDTESNAKKTTHFGFETIEEEVKEEKVYEVFHRVAETYDLMNDVMSVGIHRLWKDHFMEQMYPVPGTKLLDLAGGTGDIAFRFLKHIENQQQTDDADSEIRLPREVEANVYMDRAETDSSSDSSSDEPEAASSHVTVCDINNAMLDVGRQRAANQGIHSGISWVQGNAEELPFAENSFDIVSMAFGIRNCTHPDKVLAEAYRVLKPKGRFMCLEFSQVNNPLIRKIYDEYSFQVIPVMGQLVAGDWKSYQYLVESIRNFPNQKAFAAMFRDVGFKAVHYEDLSLGVAAIHSGFKL